jgi:Phage gp6-like head-tail connector protein
MTAVLVSLAEAKEHLKITWPAGDPGDSDVQLKLDGAEAIIRDYLTKNDPTWTPSTVPEPIRHAILLQLGWMYVNRGDEDTNLDKNDIWPALKQILAPYHMPAFA